MKRWIARPLAIGLAMTVWLQPALAQSVGQGATPAAEAKPAETRKGDVLETGTGAVAANGDVREAAEAGLWEIRGPDAPPLARGLYLAGIAGLGVAGFYTFFYVSRFDLPRAARVGGLAAASFASLYVSFRIELDSGGDDGR